MESLEQIIESYPDDYKKFLTTGEFSDRLYQELYNYYLNSGEMPYGIAKARTGDPDQWIARQLYKRYEIALDYYYISWSDYFKEWEKNIENV